MQTFQDYVTSNKMHRLAGQAFTLMVQHGYDPMAFVEWFEDEGVYLSVREAAVQAKGGLRRLDELSWANLVGKGWLWGRGKQQPKGPSWDEIGGPEMFPHDETPGAAGAAQGATPGQPQQPMTAPQMGDLTKQRAVQNAVTKLQDLQYKDWIYDKNPQLTAALNQIVQLLQAPQVPVQQTQPPAAPTEQPAKPPQVHASTIAPVGSPPPGGAHMAPSFMNADWRTPAGSPLREYNKMLIDRTVDKLVRAGINPMLFVDWYSTEGIFCENAQVFEGRLGDWMGAIGKGIGSWFGGSGFKHGYDARYNTIAVQTAGAARQALADLQSTHPDLGGPNMASNLKFAIGELDKIIKEKGGTEFKDINKPASGVDWSKLKGPTPGEEQPPGSAQPPAAAKPAEPAPAPVPAGHTPGTTAPSQEGIPPETITKLRNAIDNPSHADASDPQVAEILNNPQIKAEVERIHKLDDNDPQFAGKDPQTAKHELIAQQVRNIWDQLRSGHIDVGAQGADWYRPIGKPFMEWLRERQ
jgi:hypothetical protein